MKEFMDDNFLLENKTAEILYHDYAKDMPILDYHCHLSPSEIAADKTYRNITDIWLGGDHYKWRAMRSSGIDESYITGNQPDKEKFQKFAEVMSECIGNPLFHWNHLELRRYFGINSILSPDTAEEIWENCNSMLKKPEFSARNLIRRSNVKAVCTTDDPVDDLRHHAALAKETGLGFKVLPAFRPDKAINIERPGFLEWMGKLEQTTGIKVKNSEDLKAALEQRIVFFNQHGCRISDHALDTVSYEKCSEDEADEIIRRALDGQSLSTLDIDRYKTFIMIFLGGQYKKFDWVMQLHIGCIRNTNSTMMRLLGPDTGFDAIGDKSFAQALIKLLDSINTGTGLPKTILYCLNPRDNEVLAAVTGCFSGDGIPGKIQFGSGWWFNDQKDGMVKQLTALANLGVLGRFVGMLTDSRSFLSYTRHEYFRRILCNLIGTWVEKGEFPNDIKLLGTIVRDICYNNATRYFGI